MGFHEQKQPGRVYCGIALPAGRMTATQMRGVADIAERFGSGTVRLTVWQNVIVSDIESGNREAVETALRALGLTANPSTIRAGLVACTGNTGCKFSASDTKRHALAIAAHLDSRLALDTPLNIHLTGCPHSCAQHAIGDVGLLATKIPKGDAEVEGYHVFVGGGFGDQLNLGREALRDVPADQVPQVLERLLRAYLQQRSPAAQTVQEFLKDRPLEELRGLMQEPVTEAA